MPEAKKAAKPKAAPKRAAPKAVKMTRMGDVKEVRGDLVDHFLGCGWKKV